MDPKKPFLNQVIFVSTCMILLFIACFLVASGGDQPELHVDILALDGPIGPIIAQYITRGIETAESDGAEAVIIQMDTPGGLMESMDDIVKQILSSRVPVVVYVAPRGARAGSAGVFITMAAHVAAMAPTTNIGAAHPVGTQGEDIQQDLRDKVINDAVARIRGLATARGRNADWAEEAVRKSASVTADQAVEMNVVELIADSLDTLLAKIDGRTVETTRGSQILRTRDAHQVHIEMTLSERLLNVITEPNIAYILLSLGSIALVAEFYHPGAIFPGVSGAICLILAFTAFGILPTNWAGVGLIVLAIILFLLDLKVQGYALSIGGGIAFVLGSILLFKPSAPSLPDAPELSVSPWLIAVMTVLWGGFFVFVLAATIKAHRAAVTSGVSVLKGAIGVAQTELNPKGTVLVQSEEWSAEAVDEFILKGEKVKVLDVVEGLRLRVTKAPT